MKEYFFKERGIYYRKNEYNSNKKTLVFVHGVSGSSSAWIPYENKFENDYNILTLDLRGHGKSQKPTSYEDYKIELFAEDIYLLIKNINIDNVIFISHSFGSVIALSFLDKYQSTVNKVILLSPQYSINNILSAKIVKPIIFGLSSILPKLKNSKNGIHIDYTKYKNSGDWNIPRTIADVKNTGIRVYLYCAKQTYLFNGEKILDKITIPVLIVHGRKDTIFPVKYVFDIAQKIKNSKIQIIEHTNHILVLNNFPEVSELISNFIAEN